jgi:hypothetical protein
MSEIKSVRLSYDFKKDNYYKSKDGRNLIKTSDSSLNNYKLSVLKGNKEKDRRVILYRVSQNGQLSVENKFPPITFSYNKRYKDWLNDPDKYIEYWLSSPNHKDFSINQDPWQETVPNTVNFGSEIYFLNNSSQILILWRTREESGFQEGGIDLIYPYSLFGKEISSSNQSSVFGNHFSDDNGNELDIPRWAPEKQTYTQPISGNLEEIDYGSKNFDLETGLPITETIISGYAAKASQIKAHVIIKHLVILPPEDESEEGSIILLSDKSFSKIGEVNEDTNIAVGSMTYPGNVKDIDILKDIVDSWKKRVPNYGELDICSEKTEFCKTLPYISPIDPLEESLPEEDNKLVSEDPIADDKINLTFQIDSNISIKPREDFDFKLFIGEPPVDPLLDGFDFGDEEVDLSLLDDEFTEVEFDAEEESPSTIPEVEKELDSKDQDSNENNFEPGTYTPGTIAKLPRGKRPSGYSHTKEQGFNLLNSQWIGNLVDSAKSHVETPTFDVIGTESGNLGCAAAVSIIFYRAFGVNLKTGKPVKEKPSSLGDFGSLGTSQLSEWFQNKNLYRQIPWKESKPGDIINTPRNFETKKAGHIGIVIDEIDPKTGTYFIISNSSGGFGNSSDPLGCVKKNYTIKSWQSVTDRNPTKTFSYRYIGPSLAKPIS